MNNPNYKGSNRSLNVSLESTITDRLKNFGYESNKTGFSVGSGLNFMKTYIGIQVFLRILKN